ncbi:MAG: UDP-galactopyranose mutase [Aminipila sp.]
MLYDFLIVGSGLFGATFTQKAIEAGKRCLVIERRSHIGGNVYTEEMDHIHVHRYGPHIFHTNIEYVWKYVSRFSEFNDYIHRPLANYYGQLYNLPFNMNTFNQLWGVTTPEEAQKRIKQSTEHVENPKNLEQMAVKLVGREIFEKLIRGYTEKQWGRSCENLPASIITRLPIRYIYDNNYFNAEYQGIPVNGYTEMISNMLQGAEIVTDMDFFNEREKFMMCAKHILFTGPIDEYFGYCHGALEYRSVFFETEMLEVENYQSNSVVNYTDVQTAFTRIIEHKHFAPAKQPRTVISREYSIEWKPGIEPFYPIEDTANTRKYKLYSDLAKREGHITFGGRLGLYRYLDMDNTIERALACAEKLIR